jgi:outer membrane protein assembly factor BamB
VTEIVAFRQRLVEFYPAVLLPWSWFGMDLSGRSSTISRTAMSERAVTLLLIAAAALIVLPLSYSSRAPSVTTTSTTLTTSTMPFMSSSSSGSPAPQTTDYSAFQLVPGLGSGASEFEGDSVHLYNYTWNGEMATLNVSLGASVIAPPTVYDGLLLVDLSVMGGSGMPSSGGVAAISMQSGEVVWKTTVPNQMMTQPVTYDGLVIIGLGNKVFQGPLPSVRGTGTNYVAALNASTGDVVWTYATSGEDMPTPVITDGLVVGANGDGVVYALNPLTGQDVWNLALPKGSYVSMSSPALSDGSIYFGAADPYAFYSVSLTTGQILWSTPTTANSGLDDCSPAIWNGTVVSGYTLVTSAGLLQPVLFGMNAADGHVLWQLKEAAGAEPPAIQVPPVTISNGVVYSDPTESGTLYAVNASSGALLWTFKTGADTSNANVYDGYLSIVNSAGTMFVLNPTTGALLKATDVGAGLGPGNLVFAGQSVIVAGSSGKVISIPLSRVYPSDG